jgi:hypothetical protein
MGETWVSDHISRALAAAKAEGEAKATAEIVEWLRDQQRRQSLAFTGAYECAANIIESGEHLVRREEGSDGI